MLISYLMTQHNRAVRMHEDTMNFTYEPVDGKCTGILDGMNYIILTWQHFSQAGR